MSKILKTFIIVTLLSIVIGACAPAATPAPTKVVAPVSTGKVIPELGTYLAYPDTKGNITFSNCWGASRVPLIQAWIDGFKKYYPNITVTSDLQECAKILPTQMTQIGGGQAPNVMMILSNNLPMMAKNNALVPLNDLIARDKVDMTKFYEPEVTARTVGGKVLGLPNVTAGGQHMMFYNNALLKKIGMENAKLDTWQDLEALVEPAKKAGLFVLDPSKISTNQSIFSLLLYTNGGELWDSNYIVKFNSQEGYEAAEWLLKFIKMQAPKYETIIAGADPWNVITPKEFAVEKHVAMINGSWELYMLKNEAPQIDYKMTLMPKNANNPKSQGIAMLEGGWAFAIGAGTKDQEAAWEWIKYVTYTQAACEFVVAQNRPGTLKVCNDDPRLKSTYWPIVQQALEKSKVIPINEIYPELQQMLKDLAENIMYEKMAPKAAVDAAAAKVQARIDDWKKTGK